MGSSASTDVDLTDILGNQGAVISFTYEPLQDHNVEFKAFITGYNETFVSDATVEQIYGRIDPVHMFRRTSRQITLSFVVPAATRSEAFENLHRVDMLRSMLYPTYVYSVDSQAGNEGQDNRTDFSATIAQSPLVRIKVLNLLTGGVANSDRKTYLDLFYSGDIGDERPGALCIIQSLSVNHNLENSETSVFSSINSEGKPRYNDILPQLIELSMNFTVIHEQHMGHVNNETRGVYGLDYEASDADADAFRRRQLGQLQGHTTADLLRAGSEGPELQALQETMDSQMALYLGVESTELMMRADQLRLEEIQIGSQYGFDSQQAIELREQIQTIESELRAQGQDAALSADGDLQREGWSIDQDVIESGL